MIDSPFQVLLFLGHVIIRKPATTYFLDSYERKSRKVDEEPRIQKKLIPKCISGGVKHKKTSKSRQVNKVNGYFPDDVYPGDRKKYPGSDQIPRREGKQGGIKSDLGRSSKILSAGFRWSDP